MIAGVEAHEAHRHKHTLPLLIKTLLTQCDNLRGAGPMVLMLWLNG
jgi:hypothetical protein